MGFLKKIILGNLATFFFPLLLIAFIGYVVYNKFYPEEYPGSNLQWANPENYGSASNSRLSKMTEMMEPYAFYSENEKYGANNKALQSVLEKYDSYGGINNAALSSVLSKDFFDYYDEKENFKNNNRALQKTLITNLPPF